MMEMKVEVGKTYRHFKGHIIKVLCICKNTETLEDMVVYEHQKTHEIWARPYDMFISKVDKEKYPDIKEEYRFTKIDD